LVEIAIKPKPLAKTFDPSAEQTTDAQPLAAGGLASIQEAPPLVDMENTPVPATKSVEPSAEDATAFRPGAEGFGRDPSNCQVWADIELPTSEAAPTATNHATRRRQHGDAFQTSTDPATLKSDTLANPLGEP
jgi:hypothetical protein